VAKVAKLLAAIWSNPRNVRFGDACRAAQLLGFVHDPVPESAAKARQAA
jgi:hypothetical protein